MEVDDSILILGELSPSTTTIPESDTGILIVAVVFPMPTTRYPPFETPSEILLFPFYERIISQLAKDRLKI